jgi:hypothetical protein
VVKTLMAFRVPYAASRVDVSRGRALIKSAKPTEISDPRIEGGRALGATALAGLADKREGVEVEDEACETHN